MAERIAFKRNIGLFMAVMIGIGAGFEPNAYPEFGQCVHKIARHPDAILEIESDPHAEAFYLRMGAVRVGSTARNWNGPTRTLPILRYYSGARQ